MMSLGLKELGFKEGVCATVTLDDGCERAAT
jgi:hypothetical protein